MRFGGSRFVAAERNQVGNVYTRDAISFDVRWLWTAVPGACLVAFAFWEIFQDLFDSTRRGSFSDWVGRSVFRLFRRHPSLLSRAGPLTLVIIFSRPLFQALGFAFPQDFQLNPSTQSGEAYGFWYFVAAIWIPIYIVIYWGPHIFASQ